MINSLNHELNLLGESKIKEDKFDVLRKTISFQLSSWIFENGVEVKEIEHDLIFREVSAFLYVKDTPEYKFNFTEYEEGDFLTLESIGYYENGIGDILIKSDVESWANQYSANANFGIEIGTSMLLIEAGIVEINGKTYHTKKLDDTVVE